MLPLYCSCIPFLFLFVFPLFVFVFGIEKHLEIASPPVECDCKLLLGVSSSSRRPVILDAKHVIPVTLSKTQPCHIYGFFG